MMQSEQVLEWQAEAEKRGKAAGMAWSILKLLDLRFSQSVPAGLAERIRETADLALLGRWFKAAFTAPTMAAFRKELNGRKSGKKTTGRES